MRLSMCTISFRHHLISLDQVADWALELGFQGIELWGIHAKHLKSQPKYDSPWLASRGLYVSMLSDYLPLERSDRELMEHTHALCSLAAHWGTRKVRTFAGQSSSCATTERDRQRLVRKLRLACTLAQQHGSHLLIETHPGTLADSTASTLRLLAEVNHPALRVNFDVLHVWEAGDDPLAALEALKPCVDHYHLKNIASRSQLHVFAPGNVYAPAGNRDGMVSLFEGAFDYRRFLSALAADADCEASLEWFGHEVRDVLTKDCAQLHHVTSRPSVATEPSPRGRALDSLPHHLHALHRTPSSEL